MRNLAKIQKECMLVRIFLKRHQHFQEKRKTIVFRKNAKLLFQEKRKTIVPEITEDSFFPEKNETLFLFFDRFPNTINNPMYKERGKLQQLQHLQHVENYKRGNCPPPLPCQCFNLKTKNCLCKIQEGGLSGRISNFCQMVSRPFPLL